MTQLVLFIYFIEIRNITEKAFAAAAGGCNAIADIELGRDPNAGGFSKAASPWQTFIRVRVLVIPHLLL